MTSHSQSRVVQHRQEGQPSQHVEHGQNVEHGENGKRGQNVHDDDGEHGPEVDRGQTIDRGQNVQHGEHGANVQHGADGNRGQSVHNDGEHGQQVERSQTISRGQNVQHGEDANRGQNAEHGEQGQNLQHGEDGNRGQIAGTTSVQHVGRDPHRQLETDGPPAPRSSSTHAHAPPANGASSRADTYASRPLPDRAELLPGIWRLPLPLKDSPLGHVNTYLVRADNGYLLVDCGWDTADTLHALEGHLRALDVRFGDVRHLVVTHIHPDHYGLAGRLREITTADLSFHRLERLYIESRYADANELLNEMREWLRLNGTPQSELDQLNRASTGMMERVQIAYPDRTLDGGEEIPCGAFTFKVVWTPGHSAGHICLYDRAHKVLLSGDHVLPRITPSVGLHVRSTGNPLADYLDSLRLIGKLEAELVLPGHGEPFEGLPERTGELLAHHQRRLDEIMRLVRRVAGQPCSGYGIAAQMRWGSRRVWDDLTGFERRLAVTETLAHIELLHARGQVEKQCADGVITYFVSAESA